MLFSSFKEIQDRCVFPYSSENPEDKYVGILFLVKRTFVFIPVCGAVTAYVWQCSNMAILFSVRNLLNLYFYEKQNVVKGFFFFHL